jgi:hypothetical protein
MILSKRGRHGKGGPADGAAIPFPADPQEFEELGTRGKALTSPGRAPGARDSCLPELAPDPKAIEEFETNIGICLSEVVTPYKERIDEILGSAPEDLRQGAWILTSTIQHDGSLDHQRREHLYRELISATLDSRAKDSAEEPTELSSDAFSIPRRPSVSPEARDLLKPKVNMPASTYACPHATHFIRHERALLVVQRYSSRQVRLLSMHAGHWMGRRCIALGSCL